MNFSYQIRYNRLSQQIIHKGRESEINYIKIFQNDKSLAISEGNSYSEDQFIQNFLDNLHEDVNYSSQKARHQS